MKRYIYTRTKEEMDEKDKKGCIILMALVEYVFGQHQFLGYE